MANDFENTFISELQHCQFAIRLEESTFWSLTIAMAYVRFHSSSLKYTVDEFLFVNDLQTDSKREAIFSCLLE